MRIIVRDGEHNLNIPFPTGLMVNGLTARVACAALRKKGVPITQKQMAGLMKAWGGVRPPDPHWAPVGVEGPPRGGVVNNRKKRMVPAHWPESSF